MSSKSALPACQANRWLTAGHPPRLVHLRCLASRDMSDSIQAESAGKPGFTRRRFIIGTVGAGAVTALAGTTVRPPRALAATAPSGPAHHHAAAADHHGARAAAADLGQQPGPRGHGLLERARHGRPARAVAGHLDPADHRRAPRHPDQAARAGPAGRDQALPRGVVGQLHRRAQRPDHVLLPRPAVGPGAGNAVLLPGQRRREDAVDRGLLVRDRAARAGQVPLLQLRRPVHPVLGPELVGQHLARVLRQLLVRGDRDREPGRRQGRAAVPPPQRRPVLRQPRHLQRARRVAGLRQQRGPQRRQPAVDAGPRQPRDRVRHRHATPA